MLTGKIDVPLEHDGGVEERGVLKEWVGCGWREKREEEEWEEVGGLAGTGTERP